MEILPNVLIVDDAIESLILFEIVTKKLKMNLIQALSGSEALEKIKGVELALAIIDVKMPEMNGYELAIKINEGSSIDKVPIVFVTASHTNDDDIIKGYNSGAVDYIFKPVNNNILYSKINIFLDLYNQRQTIVKEATQLEKATDELIMVNTILKNNEQKYRNYIDNAPDGIFVTDEKRVYLEVNNAACRITGYSKDELLTMTFDDLLLIKSKNEVSLMFFQMVLNAGSSKTELSFKHKNGLNRWWSVEAVKLSKTRILIFAKDITKRIELEEKVNLHRNELELQNEELMLAIYRSQKAVDKYIILYDFAPSCYYTISKEGDIKELNVSAASLLGNVRKDLINANFIFFISNATKPDFQIFLNNLFNSNTKQICEVVIETKNNQLKYVHIEGIIVDKGEKCLLNVVDITENKHAENIIRESESNLSEAQRIAHIGSWEWDMISNNVKWSKEMFRVFDIDTETYNGKPDTILSVIHPDDIELFTQSMEHNLSGVNSPTLEYRVVHKDGSIHNLIAEGIVDYNEAGSPYRSIGTVQDITESKKVEADLHRTNSFLDSIVENIPHMIFIKDAKSLKFIRFNKAGEELLGISNKEIIGKSDYDFFVKEQADYFIEKDHEVLRSKKMLDVSEEYISSKHQGIRALHTKKVPIFNVLGEPEYLLGISEDITDRKIAEQLLKESEEKYRTMLNASPDCILLIDLKGIITEASEIGVELLGFENRGELIGKRITQFVPSEEKKTYKEIIEKTITEGLAQNIEFKVRKKNQLIFFSEISATLIQNHEGAALSYMIIIRDISQRKKMETKQIHADRMANLGEMATGIAHEINQPLNIISMVMDKFLFDLAKIENIDNEYFKKKSDKVFDNITRIRNIIDHIRAFSRSNDGYVLIAFDVNSSIENAISMIKEQFKHLGISLNLQLNRQIPQIFGNTYQFEQVVINLLVNAKDAVIEKKTKQEDIDEMIIGIKTYHENKFLIVEISDNGIGISNDDINNITLPFYTTKEEGKGTGLGLTICYQIIKEMAGAIEISSEVNCGTTVKLVLNIQK
jgi:PAS domain S-box-containing protein